jgi:hypothetical protein
VVSLLPGFWVASWRGLRGRFAREFRRSVQKYLKEGNEHKKTSQITIIANYLLTPVGVKKAGIPAPAARILSAIVPCGHNSIAISPERYFFSKDLFAPRNESVKRVICPEFTSGESPPPPAAPALFETAVRLLRELIPLLSIAAIIVSGFPYFH